MYLHNIDDKTLTSILGIEARCPQCHADLSGRVQSRLLSGNRVQCIQCGFYGTWRYGTELHAARISNAQFIMMFHGFILFPTPSPSDFVRISKTLELDINTIKSWHSKIMTAIAGDQ